jgi:hypothetical protein
MFAIMKDQHCHPWPHSRGMPHHRMTCCADFLDMHPGGAQRLMLAAGGAIDPFWAMYAQHNTAEVRQMLEGYRIGNLVRLVLPATGLGFPVCKCSLPPLCWTACKFAIPHSVTLLAGGCRCIAAGGRSLCK